MVLGADRSNDQINVGTIVDYASPLRDEDESYGSTRVEYYTKVEETDG